LVRRAQRPLTPLCGACSRDAVDPDNSKLLLDLTHRGLPSELNRRWRPPGYNSDDDEDGGGGGASGVDEAALAAGAPFVASLCFVGAVCRKRAPRPE
jgi:hypothetical protein